ncbi:MAG TPA: 1,2-phenylacetyl-CoA epoxidase subunit PaaD [Phycisphaerae bacterium]|jgi:ring-1,2-phenylacetyl-CoA epoxidase subunit PaaD
MVSESEILDVLKTIPDPEMPISIVELGIVHRVKVESPGVTIDLLPTFIGCPALVVLQQQISEKLSALEGVGEVTVNFVYDPPWTVERISATGRAALASLGITVPRAVSALAVTQINTALPASILCPFCGSAQTHLDSSFGPTRCKMIYYCEGCGSPFEHLKQLG